MITVSNIRAKNEFVRGWYEADLRDTETGDTCIGRWEVTHPYQVNLYAYGGGMIGDIIRSRDPEAANVVEAFVTYHAGYID